MASQAVSSPSGLAGRFGLNVHHFEFEPEAFPLIAEARASWVRLAAWWRLMEKQQGTIDFDYLDRSVDAALASGLQVLIVFASVPAWANGTPPQLGIIDRNAAFPPSDPRFFQDFVTAVATRYRGRAAAYEIWNEPNYKEFWNGPFSQFISQILISGAKAVKAADPAALTLGPATDSSPNLFAQAALQASPVLDVLSCHLYNKQQSAATFLTKADAQYALVKKQCKKPLWVTEFGVDSWDKGEDVQASELVTALSGLSKRPYLQRLFFFQWRDGYWPTPKQRGWGLVANSLEGFRRKKSFWALQDLVLSSMSLPGVAGSPQPADGATNVPVATTFTWSPGRAASSHRISLGKDALSLLGQQSGSSFQPVATPLQPGQTYVWRVDEVGNGGTTDGHLWHFTVEDDPAAIADVLVRIQGSCPYCLSVTQGQGSATCAPVRSLVPPGTAGQLAPQAWTAVTPAAGPTDLTFLLPAGPTGNAAPDRLTIGVSGLRPGATYKIFGRFVTTTQQASHHAALRLGLDATSMTLYGVDSPEATVVRKNGRWSEREVPIGTVSSVNGSLQVLLDTQGAPEAAGWSGLRLQMVPPEA